MLIQKTFRFRGTTAPSKTGRDLKSLLAWAIKNPRRRLAREFIYRSRSFAPTAKTMGFNPEALRTAFRRAFIESPNYRGAPKGFEEELGPPISWEESEIIQLTEKMIYRYMEAYVTDEVGDDGGISADEAKEWLRSTSEGVFSFRWCLKVIESQNLTEGHLDHGELLDALAVQRYNNRRQRSK